MDEKTQQELRDAVTGWLAEFDAAQRRMNLQSARQIVQAMQDATGGTMNELERDALGAHITVFLNRALTCTLDRLKRS
jgi:hypothetical protein